MGATAEQLAPLPMGFAPQTRVEDAAARYWLGQVTLRLRREVSWLWHARGTLQGLDTEGVLPPAIDPLSDALDLVRYDGDKHRFFAEDPTARHLGDRLATARRPAVGDAVAGGFGDLVRRLDLGDAECFLLALALGAFADSAQGAVIAACQNSGTDVLPNLRLLQILWDDPTEILPLLDPEHPLYSFGLTRLGGEGWSATVQVPQGVARQLLHPSADLPRHLALHQATGSAASDDRVRLAVARLKARPDDRISLLPLVGPADGPHRATAQAICHALGRPLIEVRRRGDLASVLTLAWSRGAALVVPFAQLADTQGRVALPHNAPPVTLFVAMTDDSPIAQLPPQDSLPKLDIVPLDYAGRLAAWRGALPAVWSSEAGQAALTECARRFRMEAAAIIRVAAAAQALDVTLDRDCLLRACREDLDLGALAQPVTSRFSLHELMLPPKQSEQITDLVRAVGALSKVHHDWGLARAWNESGLSVLFTGPPGTGKTMAAEAIAKEVAMPMYRIDLSQVVNKYIGETEKNLRQLFDAADNGDAILFFDEADALFGKRTEVKDAHDRYANLEVSYLLERMERFRGMAILASNRRKDLDDAFLRRLRYIVHFPLPGPEERLRIWRAVLPEGVDTEAVDLEFLAERMPLSGGHIRSAVFNACLQSATSDGGNRLEMGAVVRALKAEFDKLERTVSRDQFGPYAKELRDER